MVNVETTTEIGNNKSQTHGELKRINTAHGLNGKNYMRWS